MRATSGYFGGIEFHYRAQYRTVCSHVSEVQSVTEASDARNHTKPIWAVGAIVA
jgi:hypothetical protein